MEGSFGRKNRLPAYTSSLRARLGAAGGAHNDNPTDRSLISHGKELLDNSYGKKIHRRITKQENHHACLVWLRQECFQVRPKPTDKAICDLGP